MLVLEKIGPDFSTTPDLKVSDKSVLADGRMETGIM